MSPESRELLWKGAIQRLNAIAQRRNELTFKFSPYGFLPEEFRKALIRGLKSALNGQAVVGPLCDLQYGIAFGASTTPYMCNYLREAFSSLHLSEAVNDAFSYYSSNIWGIRISDSGVTASSGLPQALGIGDVFISPKALYDLRRLYYRQMVTDLKKEQRAFNRLKRFVQLYEKALTSKTYNRMVTNGWHDGNAYLCYALPAEERNSSFEPLMNALMFAEAPRGLLFNQYPYTESSMDGLVHRLAQAAGWGRGGNSEASAAGVTFNYRARLWHQDRLAELKGILNGAHV